MSIAKTVKQRIANITRREVPPTSGGKKRLDLLILSPPFAKEFLIRIQFCHFVLHVSVHILLNRSVNLT